MADIFRDNAENATVMNKLPEKLWKGFVMPPWNAREANAIVRRSNSIRSFAFNFFGAFCAAHNKTRWVEKTPLHIFFLPIIRRVFPEARFVLIIRNAYDVIGSLMHVRGWSPQVAVNRWISMYSAAIHYLDAPQIFKVYFEDVLATPDEAFEAIFDFMGERMPPKLASSFGRVSHFNASVDSGRSSGNSQFATLISKTQSASKAGVSKATSVHRPLTSSQNQSSARYFFASAAAVEHFRAADGKKLLRRLGYDAQGRLPSVVSSYERLARETQRAVGCWSALRMGLMIAPTGPGTPLGSSRGWNVSEQRHGELSISGPSLVHVPERGLYLYFGPHRSRYLRLATAPSLSGPWTLSPSKIADLGHTNTLPCTGHIASPDVEFTGAEFRMTFHAVHKPSGQQATFWAKSANGVDWIFHCERPLGPPYFRVFFYGGHRHAIARAYGNNGTVMLREEEEGQPWRVGMHFLPQMRHAAVLLEGNRLTVIYSDVGDAPERLKVSTIALGARPWTEWSIPAGQELLMPEEKYEGTKLPLAPSSYGTQSNVRQLRDPAIYKAQKSNELYLLYCVRGEGGIALARLVRRGCMAYAHAAS